MSDLVNHRGGRAPDTLSRGFGSAVQEVAYSPLGRTTIKLIDGRSGFGSCLGCGTPVCLELAAGELALEGDLESYPGDPSRDVCPSRAISWSADGAAVEVSEDECIGCGICVSRCPYGAISLTKGAVARVEYTDPDGLVISGASSGAHPRPRRTGLIAKPNAHAAALLPDAVAKLPDARAQTLVRNLLNAVGLRARVKRRGDTNMRIDAVGVSKSGRAFVAEIELTAAVLESPRALLEDVAILHSRYGFSVAEVDPVSVILALPNVRSEYYQVIRDIDAVLGIKCRTITVGALVVLLWSFKEINAFSGPIYFTGDGEVNLAKIVGSGLEWAEEPYPGAFTPVK